MAYFPLLSSARVHKNWYLNFRIINLYRESTLPTTHVRDHYSLYTMVMRSLSTHRTNQSLNSLPIPWRVMSQKTTHPTFWEDRMYIERVCPNLPPDLFKTLLIPIHIQQHHYIFLLLKSLPFLFTDLLKPLIPPSNNQSLPIPTHTFTTATRLQSPLYLYFFKSITHNNTTRYLSNIASVIFLSFFFFLIFFLFSHPRITHINIRNSTSSNNALS